jgi:hypothetical protein
MKIKEMASGVDRHPSIKPRPGWRRRWFYDPRAMVFVLHTLLFALLAAVSSWPNSPTGFKRGLEITFVILDFPVVLSLVALGHIRNDNQWAIPWWVSGMYTVVVGGLWWVLLVWVILRNPRKATRPQVPTCARCAYNLTGNESGVCPECGTPMHFPGSPGRGRK